MVIVFQAVMKLYIRTREHMGNIFKCSGNNCMESQDKYFWLFAHKDKAQS